MPCNNCQKIIDRFEKGGEKAVESLKLYPCLFPSKEFLIQKNIAGSPNLH